MKTCTNAASPHQIADDALFCPHDGTKAAEAADAAATCVAGCGQAFVKGITANFCPKCGVEQVEQGEAELKAALATMDSYRKAIPADAYTTLPTIKEEDIAPAADVKALMDAATAGEEGVDTAVISALFKSIAVQGTALREYAEQHRAQLAGQEKTIGILLRGVSAMSGAVLALGAKVDRLGKATPPGKSRQIGVLDRAAPGGGDPPRAQETGLVDGALLAKCITLQGLDQTDIGILEDLIPPHGKNGLGVMYLKSVHPALGAKVEIALATERNGATQH